MPDIWMVYYYTKEVDPSCEIALLRLLALNLNHRTRPVPIKLSLVEAVAELDPDVIAFNEYVDEGEAGKVKGMLCAAGYEHQAVSDSVEYRRGRWHNQVLIASRSPIEEQSVPANGPDEMSRTNTLTVRTFGVSITGIRVPAYTSAADWYQYWEWMNDQLKGDVAIGDFNADPGRPRKWDRVLETLNQRGGWSRKDIDGPWSYCGNNGSTSRVDHVLSRGPATVLTARYVAEPFVPLHSDHAALVADVTIS